MIIEVTEKEYSQHVFDDDGVCLDCGEWDLDYVDPDAAKCTCGACGRHSVMGAERAFSSGYIKFKEDS